MRGKVYLDMAPEQQTKRRGRSPSYPGIGLEAALQRAQELYDYQGRNPAAVDVVLQRWGYKPRSGGGMVVLAALKKFGLVDDEGSGDTRRAKLSRRALSILLDERTDSPERQEAIRTAALEPAIHRELWERYEGTLPTDEALATYLRLERKFTDSAVREFVPQFRQTLAFAGLTGNGATVPRHEGDNASPDEERPVTPSPAAPSPPAIVDSRNRRESTYAVPLPGDARMVIQGTFPLTTEEWELVSAQIDLMKRALVVRDGSSDS